MVVEVVKAKGTAAERVVAGREEGREVVGERVGVVAMAVVAAALVVVVTA